MTPTTAQIEAALWAYNEAEGLGRDKRIEAALTAAAEISNDQTSRSNPIEGSDRLANASISSSNSPTQAQIEAWPYTADAAQWAREFRKTAIKLGYSDMDEGWLIGWFANAIENAEMIRHPAIAAAAEVGEQYTFNQPKTGTPSPTGSFEILAQAPLDHATIERCARHLQAIAHAIPLGFECRSCGRSAYNWLSRIGRYLKTGETCCADMKEWCKRAERNAEEARRINEASGRQERALAAAAEAEQVQTIDLDGEVMEDGIPHLTAAAEVGEKTTYGHLLGPGPAIRSKNETIERCAQVTDSVDCDHKTGSIIAKRLRALKE